MQLVCTRFPYSIYIILNYNTPCASFELVLNDSSSPRGQSPPRAAQLGKVNLAEVAEEPGFGSDAAFLPEQGVTLAAPLHPSAEGGHIQAWTER